MSVVSNGLGVAPAAGAFHPAFVQPLDVHIAMTVTVTSIIIATVLSVTMASGDYLPLPVGIPCARWCGYKDGLLIFGSRLHIRSVAQEPLVVVLKFFILQNIL